MISFYVCFCSCSYCKGLFCQICISHFLCLLCCCLLCCCYGGCCCSLSHLVVVHVWLSIICIYICAVKLKTGPIFALFKVKTGPFFVFLFLPCRKKRIFEKQAKKTTKKTQFLLLKTGPIMLRNILGPVFNFNLDQFLTLEFCYFFVFCSFGGLKPLFYSVFISKNAKLKETQKTKRTLFVNTPVLTVLVKMSVFLHF